MKRVSKIIVLTILTIMFIAGCTMKFDYQFVVGSDKQIDLKMTMAYDKEFIDRMSYLSNTGLEAMSEDGNVPELTDEQRWAYVDEIFKELGSDVEKKKYDKDGFYGYVMTVKGGNIDEVSASSATDRVNLNTGINGMGESVEVEDFDNKVLFIKTGDNKYKSNMTYKQDGETQQEMSSAKQYGAIFDMTITLSLPVKTISNNATNVSDDGKTLTWDLSKVSDIDFEFDLSSVEDKANNKGGINISDSMIYIGVGGLCIAIIIVVIVVIKSKNNKNNANNTTVETPTNPLESTPNESITPVVPEAPVEPVVPTESVTPVVSEAPVEPVAQVEPEAPVVPEVPVEPVVPTESVTPVVSEAPVEPVAQVEPKAPVMPEVPVEPVVPTESVTPVVSEAPVEPVVQAEPEAPVMPEVPVEPIGGETTVQPTEDVQQDTFNQ